MRWARRAFHERQLGYDEIVARAAEAPAGSDGLFFLPYLTGERLGAHRNARAQFFGIGAAHGLRAPPPRRAGGRGLRRAAPPRASWRMPPARRLERSSLGRRRQDRALAEDQGEHLRHPDRRARGGGMRRRRLRGHGRDGDRALRRRSRTRSPPMSATPTRSRPIPPGRRRYGRMQPVFDRLYCHSQALYDDLDALADPLSQDG